MLYFIFLFHFRKRKSPPSTNATTAEFRHQQRGNNRKGHQPHHRGVHHHLSDFSDSKSITSKKSNGGGNGISGGKFNNNNTNNPKSGISHATSAFRSSFWTLIIMASVVSGGFFLHNNTSEFLHSTVQTTLDGSVPLSEVFFPSVVVCNINQIRKSFFAELGFYENDTLVRIMYEDFIKGTMDADWEASEVTRDPKRDAFYDVSKKSKCLFFLNRSLYVPYRIRQRTF